jgi:uncharacterized damage-inducible protein DinB
VNLKLLDQLSEEQLAVTSNPRARNIAQQIAHLHNVRRTWLELQNPAASKALPKLGDAPLTRSALEEALDASAKALADMLVEAQASGKIKGFKRGPLAFLGYILAHEAHHRGQILLHLKHAGKPFDRAASYALWEWDKI